jgi:hypothetical protein
LSTGCPPWILQRTEALLVRRHRRWIVHVLSLAFLFAQLGMVVHASTHLKSDPHAAQSQLCGQCLSFAPLQNMAGGGAVVILAANVSHDRATEAASLPRAPRRAFTAFRSRAPPGLI